MLHFMGFMFFTGVLLMAGGGLAALLFEGRGKMLRALGIVPAAVPATPQIASRVRIRYRSHARRITPPSRRAAA